VLRVVLMLSRAVDRWCYVDCSSEPVAVACRHGRRLHRRHRRWTRLDVIVTPLSTMGYTSVAWVFHSRQLCY